jgi:putative ABC transport system permease protein
MKYILKMAFRNIGRNKRRTMLSAIAISIAVMVVVVMRGYIGGIMDSMFDSLTKIETGHIKIAHPEYYEKADMMPLEYMVDGLDGGGYKQLLPILEPVEGVKFIAPRIKFGVLLSFRGRSRSALGLGIDPRIEDEITSFNRIMVEGQYFGTDENAKSIIMGTGLADRLGIKLDDKLTILARTAYDSLRGMTFRVTGTFEYGISSMDSKLFYIPIGAAAQLLEMGNGVSELILMVDRVEDADKIAEAIRDKLRQQDETYLENVKIIPWQEQETFYSMFKFAGTIYGVVYIILLILASTVIINTIMMIIYERTREIGTIGALGMTSGQIVLLFVVEAIIISAIGSFFGTVVGGGFDLFLHIVGVNLRTLSGGSMDLPSTDIIYPRFGPSILIWSFLFGIVVASVMAYIPARRAARVEPVEALRSV